MRENRLLEMQNINKVFPGVKALSNVNFSVKEGEVHALMGENGAGKSTLIKILTGIYPKDSGKIVFDNTEINPRTAMEAQQLGISTIYQELNLIGSLSIAENIFLGRQPLKNGIIDWKTIEVEAQKILKDMGLEINVMEPLDSQSTAVQQMIAIARALSINVKLVIMDEPTSSLDQNEIQVLFEVIRELKQKGISVIFISHRLDEFFEICDHVTILKDGDNVGDFPIKDVTKVFLISKMIGREASGILASKKKYVESTVKNEKLCEVKNIYQGIRLHGIDLDIKKGEIAGLAGLLGSGRTELAKVIFGDTVPKKGEILFEGKNINFRNPRDAIKKGIGFCSEDRKDEGIFPYLPIRENLTLSILSDVSMFGIISKKKQNQIVDKYIKAFEIKTTGYRQLIRNLSGGNQQKVLLSRWLCKSPKLLILDEPTRGIDVGAKAEILQLILNLAKQGISVLLISSELEELTSVCDRIFVLREGKKILELEGAEISEQRITRSIAEGHQTVVAPG
jgi:ABC-type sugar transport system ATPase subunit